MGARLRHRVRTPAQVAAVVLCCWALAGCGATSRDAEQRAEHLLREGGAVITTELESILVACDQALGELTAALEEAGADPGKRFAALETVRARHGVTGLDWSGPDRKNVWAGRTITPRALPAPQPWQGSYSSGQVIYHAGPFVRALIYGPVDIHGGRGTATWILDEVGPYKSNTPPFSRRWLEPLELYEVRLLHPADPSGKAPPGPCCAHAPVKAPDGTDAFVVSLHVHDLEVLQERLAARRGALEGALLLVLLVAGAIALIRFGFRRIRPSMLRWLAGAVLVLIVRALLRWMDLPGRFPPLEEAFSPSEFAVDTPLGWLASPGDFALSSIAYLLVAICVTYGVRSVRPARAPWLRSITVVGGLIGCGLACGLWLKLVEVAVAGGQTPFFQANAFIPEASAALMLTGLVALTATTFLIAHLLLRLIAHAVPGLPGAATRLVLAVTAMATTWILATALATPHWVVLAFPLIASLTVRLGAPRLGLALPSRILVLSVLATCLAYPVLWARVADRESETLEEELATVLSSEDIARAGVAAALREAREDSYLRSALAMAAQGGRPEGVALHLWLRSSSHWRRDPVIIAVLDELGRTLDRFALDTLPPGLLPAAQAPARPEAGERLFVAPGDRRTLRCVVGRVSIKDPDGKLLGHVVVTIPDRMDLRLRGLSALVAGARRDSPMPLSAQQKLQFAQLRGGRVIASSDPSLSRASGSFGPTALADLGPERPSLTWSDHEERGYGRWSEARGAVFAVRQPEPSLGDALLALARLVVVGVGLGLLAAVATLLAGLGSFHLQLHHKILLSYFGISVIPLVLLGVASAHETQARHEARLTERLQTDITRTRGELEVMPTVFDTADSSKLEEWAPQRRHDVLLYRDGDLEAASRTGLVAAELLPSRLPARAYRATVLERRQAIWREAEYAGRRVWFGFAPVLDSKGATRATVGVPLLYEADRVEEQVTLTGSVLLAAYMLTLVLVLVGGIYVARRLTRPLGVLADGTKRVAAGDLGVELEGEGADELGQLVAAFNAMTEDLRETTDRAAQAERESAWRRMASQVAHEIKNPLTPMRLMLQQMEADVARDPGKASEALRRTAPIVLKQIESLDRIARDFAHFARLPKRRKTRVDVAPLVEEVTALHSGAAAQGIHVRCAVEGELPPVYWDVEELRRVLLNMVLNAVESIRGEGEVTLRAQGASHAAADGVRITITDNGQGIPPEHIERLFEPQFSTKTRGTGLGLAIVSRILQDMGGTIAVESAPGTGSTFDLWWPVGDATPADDPADTSG